MEGEKKKGREGMKKGEGRERELSHYLSQSRMLNKAHGQVAGAQGDQSYPSQILETCCLNLLSITVIKTMTKRNLGRREFIWLTQADHGISERSRPTQGTWREPGGRN